MPKIKNKSGAKKRFSFTGTGKIKMNQAGKRHGMIKRTNKFIRNARGTAILAKADEKTVPVYAARLTYIEKVFPEQWLAQWN